MARFEKLATDFLALTDSQDWASREALQTADCEFVTPGAALRGPEATTAFSQAFMGAFSDARHTVGLVVSSGDVAALEGTWMGTHSKPLVTPAGEVAASGREVSLPFTMIVRATGDLMSSARIYFDQLGFMAQLGLMPSGGSGGT